MDVRFRLRGGKQFKRDAKEAATGIDAFANRVEKRGTALKGFGKGMTTNVTAPLLLAGGAAFKMSADFDDSMNKMVGLVGIGRGQIEGWKGEVLSLSRETGRAPVELADALFFITSAGLRGKAALDALSVSAKAADSGLGETKVIADAVTSAMNAYGPSNLSAARATDILTAAVKEGKLEASELAPVIGGVLPIAKAAGVEFEQVAGAIALMAKSGTNAAAGATQVTGILTSFAKPTKQMTTALDDMGLSLDGVRKMLATKGLLPTLAMLRKRAKEAGVDLSAVFGNKRALTGVLQLTGNLKETKSVMEGVAKSQGLSAKAFAEAQKTSKDKLNDMTNSFKVAAIRIGSSIGPVVVPMMEDIGKAIGDVGDKFAEMSPTQQKVILGFVAFVAIMGPAIWIIGSLATGVAVLITMFGTLQGVCLVTRLGLAALWIQTKLMAVWAGVVKVALLAWSAAQWLLNVALSANPIVLVVLAVIALAAAFYLAYKKVDWFRNLVDTVFGFVKRNWKWLILPLSPILAPIVLIATNFTRIKTVAGAVFSWVKGAALNFVGFMRSIPGRLAGAFKGMFNGIKGAYRSAINWIIGKWNGLEFKIPSVKLPGIGKVGGGTISTPDIPLLAGGGFIPSGAFGSFVSGERGAELNTVTPQGIQVQPLSTAPAGAGGGFGSFSLDAPIVVKIAERVVAETVARVTRKELAKK